MQISNLVKPLALLAGLMCADTSAASLQVYPVTLTYCNGEVARPLYLKNTGTESIGTQMRLYLWTQENHLERFTPTQDLISSPPVASIPANKQQLVRIVALNKDTSREKAYRLIVDELPGLQSDLKNNQVKFLLRYSIPVFISCDKNQPQTNKILASVIKNKAKNQLVVRNLDAHAIKLSSVTVKTAKTMIPITQGLLGYVLSNSEMSWEIPGNIISGDIISFKINDHEITHKILL